MKTDFISECTEISQMDLLPTNPVVSVLMITYNHERFLAEAIEGIVKQVADFPFEIIIGEDCSTDKTRQIALSYQKKHPNLIRVLYSERNIGPNKNVARVMSHCRGQYIAICEGDDFWIDVKKLQIQVGFLEASPDYVVTHHGNIQIDSEGMIVDDNIIHPEINEYSNDTLVMGGFMQPLNMCFRNVIKEFPDEYYKVLSADSFLITLLGAFGKAKYLDNIIPSAYRIQQGGLWQGLSQDEKNIASTVTNFWISVYYKNIDKEKYSSLYGERSIEKLITSINLKDKILIKLVVKHQLPLFYKLMRIIKKFLS